MPDATSLDLVVIGSGPGGYRAAVLGALRGLSVAIVERGEWGGTCLNRGCVPKKTWYETAQAAAANARYAARGLRGRLEPDLAQAWRHQHEVVRAVRESYVDYLRRLGVRAHAGAARFVDAHTIDVAGERLAARHVIVATGSSPGIPAHLPLHADRILSTDDLFDRPVPAGRRVAVVGSGVVGTEMAFILAMLGCDVTWLTGRAPLAGDGFGPAALRVLNEALAAHGIVPRTGSRPLGADVRADAVVLRLPGGVAIEADWVLLGTGRVPNTGALELARAGIATDAEGFIVTDTRLRTSQPHVFAIGDCAHPEMTANHALADATVAIGNIVAPGSARRDADAVPHVVYSAIELARVGLSEDEAEARGLEPAVGFGGFEANPAALAADAPRGFVRVVADHDAGTLLGAEVAGLQAGEVIHVAAPLVGRADGLRTLAALRYNHPSATEEFLNAVETLAAKWGLEHAVFGRWE
jgi:dihydrolipoamide dehydrogenase